MSAGMDLMGMRPCARCEDPFAIDMDDSSVCPACRTGAEVSALRAEVERLKAELVEEREEAELAVEALVTQHKAELNAERERHHATHAEIDEHMSRMGSVACGWAWDLAAGQDFTERYGRSLLWAQLEDEKVAHHATAGELNKAVTWLDRCAWARSVIDLDAGPLEVQLAEALGRVERLTAENLSLRNEVHAERHRRAEFSAEAAELGTRATALKATLRELVAAVRGEGKRPGDFRRAWKLAHKTLKETP